MSKKKKAYDTIPQLKLKGEDYSHNVPEQYSLSLFVEWRNKNLDRDEISNVKFFEKKDGELLVVNRANDTIRYRYLLKEIKRVFVVLE